jgi:RNA polymerase sigma-70 factor, ECF subfamily
MDPDAKLMVRFRDGDRAAFEALFEKYHLQMINFCFRFLGNRDDAEELAQETFLNAYQAAPGYRPLTKFSTWLYTIAKNLCLNRLRKENPARFGRISFFRKEETVEEEAAMLPDEGPTPEREVADKELAEIVRRTVRELPAPLRLAVILHRYHELSYDEIAKIAGCSVTAVKLRLHRAKRILAAKLGPYRPSGSP